MFARFAAAASSAALFAAAAPVLADDALMTRPIEAASLATEDVSLVAYYTPLDDAGVEVTLTWIAAGGATPSRLRMRLDDGADVSFSLPGHMDTLLSFAREDDVVRFTTTPVTPRYVAASL